MNVHLRSRPHATTGVMLITAIAEFMLVLDVSIVNVALPSVGADLAVAQTELQWVVTAYALAFGGFMLVGGRAADLFGGRRIFLVSLSAFTLASLVCGLATNALVLIYARALQGLSAGVLSPATLSILTTTYSDEEGRRRALAMWTAVATGGGAVGALLGGLLTETLAWRWIFLVNVPIGLVVLVGAWVVLDGPPAGHGWRDLDLAGALTATLGLGSLVWALESASSNGWASWGVSSALIAALVVLAAFVTIEVRIARAPLVPVAFLRSRNHAAANLLSFLSFMPVIATWFFLSLYLQRVREFTPLQTGVIFVPLSIAVVAASQFAFRVSLLIGGRRLYCAGALTAAAGLMLLARLSGAEPLTYVVTASILAMLGGGLMFAPIMLAGTSEIGPDRAGLASGLLNTTRQIGGALGLAMLNTLTTFTSVSGSTAGYAHAFALGAAIYALNALAALALPADEGRRAQFRGRLAHQ
jgi:EmrB/QacA subfamily drug resistance transporter